MNVNDLQRHCDKKVVAGNIECLQANDILYESETEADVAEWQRVAEEFAELTEKVSASDLLDTCYSEAADICGEVLAMAALALAEWAQREAQAIGGRLEEQAELDRQDASDLAALNREYFQSVI